eukprot:COSAG06_NODE_56855_length_282_cov_830.961749_2_plen_49_part_01
MLVDEVLASGRSDFLAAAKRKRDGRVAKAQQGRALRLLQHGAAAAASSS